MTEAEAQKILATISETRRASWEQLGVDAIEGDLNTGGLRHLGGTLEVRAQAQQWVSATRVLDRLKNAPQPDVFIAKPTFWGFGIDLKAALSRLSRWWRRK